MTQSRSKTYGVEVIIGFHAFSFLAWSFGQTGAVISYDTVAAWGFQDARALVDPVIVQVNQGIGLADTIVQLPLFLLAIVGLVRKRFYGAVASWLVFGTTLYWPVVFWSSQLFYARGGTMHVPTSPVTAIIPGVILAFAVWGSWYLARHRAVFR